MFVELIHNKFFYLFTLCRTHAQANAPSSECLAIYNILHSSTGRYIGWTDESDITGKSADELHMSLPGFEPATGPFREPQSCRVHLSIGFHVSQPLSRAQRNIQKTAVRIDRETS
jgi:hypothetical protein